MRQERLIQELSFNERLEKATERVAATKTYDAPFAKMQLESYKVRKYALSKVIAKDARMEKNRAHCPDCGTNIRFSDNFCRRCGQRLKMKIVSQCDTKNGRGKWQKQG